MSEILQASAIAQPVTCRICGAVIGHFAVSWPADTPFNQQEFGRMFKSLTQHMQKRAQGGEPKHQAALLQAAAIGGNLTQASLARHFKLPAAGNAFVEQCRGSVHAMTSKFTLTREYAETIARAVLDETNRLSR